MPGGWTLFSFKIVAESHAISGFRAYFFCFDAADRASIVYISSYVFIADVPHIRLFASHASLIPPPAHGLLVSYEPPTPSLSPARPGCAYASHFPSGWCGLWQIYYFFNSKISWPDIFDARSIFASFSPSALIGRRERLA